MKNTSLIVSIVALVVAGVAVFFAHKNDSNEGAAQQETAIAAEKGAIVWFNMDTVLQMYDKANDLKSVVETKIQSINSDVNKRGSSLEKEIAALQEKIDKGLLTRSVIEVQGQKLEQKRVEFQQYAAKKQQEAAEEQQVMMNQIADAINTFIQKYKEEKGFAMILATQGDILPAPVVAADPALDVTEEILAGLNAEYVKEKAKGNK